MTAFLTSLIFVVLAEMGDKTQLLAMAFASRFRWQTVMWGVFVATAANHLMATPAKNSITVLMNTRNTVKSLFLQSCLIRRSTEFGID